MTFSEQFITCLLMVFQGYIRSLIDMPISKVQEIQAFFESGHLEKGELLLSPGQISRKSYFLEEGIIRAYIIDVGGNEVTTRIYTSPVLLNDYLSFFKKEPSREYFQAVTVCHVQTIDFESLQTCFHTIPEFREAGRMMLTLNYATLQDQMISFHTMTAEERYQKLLADRPEVIQKVPLKIIASYLGMKDSSLSRIRKTLSK